MSDLFKPLAIGLVLLHGLVALLHGIAHEMTEVRLSTLGNIYVLLVIALAPLLALVLLWRQKQPVGAWVLLLSMLGALIFGLVHHYILISPDHVAHVPHTEGRGLFQVTAGLLVVTEGAGVGLGLWGVRT